MQAEADAVPQPGQAAVVHFNCMTLHPGRRTLWAGGVPVTVSGRGFDILYLLLCNRDRVLTRDEIIAGVWRDLSVGENNLTVQMSALRRVLGEHAGGEQLILTVPGRGYQFVGEVRPAMMPAEPAAAEDLPVVERAAAAPRRAAHVTLASVALAMLAVLVLVWHAGWRAGPAAPPRLSIAVLPFHNASQDPALNDVADALGDDLTTDLAHMPGSTVIARESTAVYRNQAMPAEAIGKMLHVRYLVSGSLRSDGGALHVNAHLVDAGTGAALWADSFDSPRAQLDEARNAMVRRMAAALHFQLGQLESARSLHDRPDDPDALDLFFRARALLDRDDSLATLGAAQLLLEGAVRQQPEFGDALTELGNVLLLKIRENDDPTYAADSAEAEQMIARVLGLAPRNAAALATHARLLVKDGKWEMAESSARAALAIEPSNVSAQAVLATCAQAQGRLDDAAPHIEAILRLTPESPANKPRWATLGHIRLLQGRPAEALDLLSRAIAGDPEPTPGSAGLGRAEMVRLEMVAAYGLLGRQKAAHDLLAAMSKIWPNRTLFTLQGYFQRSATYTPGYRAMAEALHAAGMPWTMGEQKGPSAEGDTCATGDFTPTPASIQGGRTIDTAQAAALMRTAPPPLVIDVGHGVAVPKGGLASLDADPVDFVVSQTRNETHQSTIVLMGSNQFGCAAFTAASRLIAEGFKHIVWYRGGEEAWAASGNPADDRREQ